MGQTIAPETTIGRSGPPNAGPPPVVLEYGRPDHLDGAAAQARFILARVGGARQVALGVGLACTFGGFAYGLSTSGVREVAALWAAVGGLFVGWAVRLPQQQTDGASTGATERDDAGRTRCPRTEYRRPAIMRPRTRAAAAEDISMGLFKTK